MRHENHRNDRLDESPGFEARRGKRWRVVLLACFSVVQAFGLEIKLPPETGTFRQDSGAEIANAQCLICHSVEYVTMQPPMPRPFWKSSVQKMQQKYGAPIPDAQVEELADYLARNYGVTTNSAPASHAAPFSSVSGISAKTGALDGLQLATKYGCFGCHNITQKIVGPAYRDIAAKYKSDGDAFAKINQQIHNGGSGKWGPIIMPPFPQVTAAETKVLAEWIMGLK